MDDRSVIDSLLESMSNGQLAAKISKAARLATARHMLLKAQEMRSAVEAENSAQ